MPVRRPCAFGVSASQRTNDIQRASQAAKTHTRSHKRPAARADCCIQAAAVTSLVIVQDVLAGVLAAGELSAAVILRGDLLG
jgi:hypothetical protein